MAEGMNRLRAPTEHLNQLPARASPRCAFDRALLRLTGYQAKHQRDGIADGRLKKMVAVFDGQATVHQIRDWRKGKPAPQWARALLKSKLAPYAQAFDGL